MLFRKQLKGIVHLNGIMGNTRLEKLTIRLVVIIAVYATTYSAAVSDDNKTTICPQMVKRAEWLARNPLALKPMVHIPTPFVVIHHGGIARYCENQANCSEIVRSYQNLHMDKNGWDDIGYSFLIGEDGNVYEGRGWDRSGRHSPKYNDQSIGICLIGDFENRLPNDFALKTLDQLINCGLGIGKISRDYRLIGHRQGRNTTCPGETFFKYVQQMPHWTDHPVPIIANDTAYERQQ